MMKMKNLARTYVWWPLIDKDIEKSVLLCHLCQQQQAAPPVAQYNRGNGLHDRGYGFIWTSLVLFKVK